MARQLAALCRALLCRAATPLFQAGDGEEQDPVPPDGERGSHGPHVAAGERWVTVIPLTSKAGTERSVDSG